MSTAAIVKHVPSGIGGKVPLRCHMGGILHNIASIYPTLELVILELVQNSIDADAKRIQLKVNLRTRFIAIRDDGKGMSRKDFDEKTSRSIGHTQKKAQDLGRFGIGFFSPTGKCEWFEMTSCPKSSKTEYTTWKFSIDPEASDIDIDWRPRTDILWNPKGIHTKSGQVVWWRTSIDVHDFKEDKAFSDVSLASITDGALHRYSAKMQRFGTRLTIDFVGRDGKEESNTVTASTFTGAKLPELSFETENSGKVVVRMYLAKRRGTSGRVNVRFGELNNDFRFPYSNFANSTAKDLLGTEVMEALGSGVFEGEILGEKAELSPRRTSFEKSDALVDLCVCIEEWFAKQGKQYLEIERRERNHERYIEIGRDALSRIDKILRSSEELRAALSKFKFGSIGTGHSKPDKGRVGKTQDEPSIGIRGRSRGSGAGASGGGPSEQELPSEVHPTVRGGGRYRHRVKGSNQSPQLAFEARPASSLLCEVDHEEGILVFNTMHRHWTAIDAKGTSDWRLRTLIEIVTMQVLTLLTMPDQAWVEHQRLFADDLNSHIVTWLLNGGGRS